MSADLTPHNNPIGICSWTLGLDHDLAALMRECVGLGLQGLQFSGDHRRHRAADLRTAAADHGLQLFAIDPFDCAPDYPNNASADAAIDYYRRVIDFAAEAGAPWTTLQGLGQWMHNCHDASAAWQRLVCCCTALHEYAAARGVALVYEVVNRYETPIIRTADEGERLRVALGGASIGLILDSFHMNIDEPDPQGTLRACAPELASYHISDSNRGGIGSGHIDFSAQRDILARTGFSGPVMIEIVLAENAPVTPPRNHAQWAALRIEIGRSLHFWRSAHVA